MGGANFYVIMGSAAAGLTGLMFVVVSLLADRGRTNTQAHHAFGTPTVFHFTVVLLLCGALSIPGHTTWSAALIVGGFGIAGTAFLVRSTLRMRTQQDYAPERSDWIWYAMAPIAVYVLLIVVGIVFLAHARTASYLTAFGTMLLLYVGIHNAWDSATYIAVDATKGDAES